VRSGSFPDDVLGAIVAQCAKACVPRMTVRCPFSKFNRRDQFWDLATGSFPSPHLSAPIEFFSSRADWQKGQASVFSVFIFSMSSPPTVWYEAGAHLSGIEEQHRASPSLERRFSEVA